MGCEALHPPDYIPQLPAAPGLLCFSHRLQGLREMANGVYVSPRGYKHAWVPVCRCESCVQTRVPLCRFGCLCAGLGVCVLAWVPGQSSRVVMGSWGTHVQGTIAVGLEKHKSCLSCWQVCALGDVCGWQQGDGGHAVGGSGGGVLRPQEQAASGPPPQALPSTAH